MSSKIVFSVSAAILVAWVALILDTFDITDNLARTFAKKNAPEISTVTTASLGVKNIKSAKATIMGNMKTVPEQGIVKREPAQDIVTIGDVEKFKVKPLADSKMGMIKSLVVNSISEDRGKLKLLNEKREELLAIVDEIETQSGTLTSRLNKLGKIQNLFSDKNIKQKKGERKGIFNLVKNYNSLFDSKQASFSRSKRNIKLSLKGDSLLLLDEKHIRISEYAANHFNPVVEEIRQLNYDVDNISIQVGKGYSEKHGEVLKRFLHRQYGWNVEINQDKGIDGLEVKVTARR